MNTASIDSSKRNFLRGRVRSSIGNTSLPWVSADFLQSCQRCDACIDACEEKILVRGDGGYPEINFNLGGCTFCRDCVGVCKHNAFDTVADTPWMQRAVVNDQCLLSKGIACRSCGDHCDERAIRFRPIIGGKSILEFNPESCTGCGGCVAPCPVNAITINHPAVNAEQ